jgi:HPr kinase/phosphorylase
MVQAHASCVLLARAGEPFGAPADAGILLLGESGSGKSDLALRLIERGAILVSDDRTELIVEGGALMASPAAALAGLIEVRGVGIIELPHAFSARIHLVVHLSESLPERLPERELYDSPKELPVARESRPALLRLHSREPSAPAKVAAAAAAHAHALFRD